MCRQGLVARRIRRRNGLTRQDKTAPKFPDLLCRDFTAQCPDQRWVGDITEIPTAAGKLYLATVIDLYSRRLLGAATSRHPDAALACAAIEMAVATRGGKQAVWRDDDAQKLIFHTDRGSTGGFNWSSQHPDSRRCGGVVTADWSRKTSDVPVGVRRQWRADRALRPAMRSPGRPEPSRQVQREFWRVVATGVSTAQASIAVGVSVPVGTRWFRHAGGMRPLSLDEPSGRYLSFAEREEIALLRVQDCGVREIARRIGRSPATISRELRRNAATRSGKLEYRALVAQWKAQQAAKRPKTAKLVAHVELREYVQHRLAGVVRRPDGTIAAGPTPPPWKGLNKPHRADRRWSLAWSPEQISQRLKVKVPAHDRSGVPASRPVDVSSFCQGVADLLGGLSAVGKACADSSRQGRGHNVAIN